MKPTQIENLIAAATPGGIEAQEKAGQIEQTFAETLPKTGTSGQDRPQWEAIGFVFQQDADDIFVNVQFPKGWRKQPTDHSMWSYLLDDKGRRRAAIFYKAAFYDRSAHICLVARFSYSIYEPTDQKNHLAAVIRDSGKVLHTLGIRHERDYPRGDELEATAMKWLDQNYPNWGVVSAYWDDVNETPGAPNSNEK
jgi:hypothetical protein